MKRLSRDQEEKARNYLNLCWYQANNSYCKYNASGAILVHKGKVIGKGKSEPLDRLCDCSEQKSETCDYKHAEENAIINGVKKLVAPSWRDSFSKSNTLRSSVLYYLEIDENKKERPLKHYFCMSCLDLMMEYGLEHLIIRHKKGIMVYTPKEAKVFAIDYERMKK